MFPLNTNRFLALFPRWSFLHGPKQKGNLLNAERRRDFCYIRAAHRNDRFIEINVDEEKKCREFNNPFRYLCVICSEAQGGNREKENKRSTGRSLYYSHSHTSSPSPPNYHLAVKLYFTRPREMCFFSLSFLSCVVVIVNNWTLLNQSKLYVGNSPVFITANTGMVCRPFWMISSSWSRAKSTRQLQSRGTKHKHTHRGKSTGKIKIERLKAFDLGVPILLSLPFFSSSSSQPEVRGYIYIQRRRGGGTRKGFFSY